jgi:hypothetical protein
VPASPELPRIPGHELGRIKKRRERLLYDVLLQHGFFHRTLDIDSFNELVMRSRRALNLKRSTETSIRSALLEFADKEITERVGDLVAIKLAGGYTLIKEGAAFAPFNGVAEPEWAPVEISELRYGKLRGHKLWADMIVTVMAGSAVGAQIKQAVPVKFATTLMATAFGWPRFDRRPALGELVRMWFMALLAQGKYGTEVAEYKCLPHQAKYNKQLKKEREQPCIRGYRQRCHICPVGYFQCPRGTHRYTWLQKKCEKCDNEKAYFDPERPDQEACIFCSTKRARRHWARERMG